MQVRRTLTLFATVTSLMVVGVAGAGATTAVASTTAELSIAFSPCEDGYGTHYDYGMRVKGETDWYSPTLSIAVDLFGDDPSYDDHLTGPITFQNVGGWGHYQVEFCVNSSTLNEDWGQDEVYATVGFSGGGFARSNVIERHF
jgi:hypothetical protein